MKNVTKFLIGISCFCCSCSQNLYEFQPNIVWGGRIVALSKDPFNDNKIIAAAPSGGIFISASKGQYWDHVNLPAFEMVDVKHSLINSNVVIATSLKDLKRKDNGGGIWRSEDGGKSWTKPPSSIAIKGMSIRISDGYGISFQPGHSANVFVGTEYGIAISNDNGATWKYNNFLDTVYAVIANAGGVVVATTSKGLFRSEDAGTTWLKVSDVVATSPRSLCYLKANNNNVFVAADGYRIFYSGDFGFTWREIPSPEGGSGREPFIRSTVQHAKFFGLDVVLTYLYYGNGPNLFRKIIHNADNNNGNVFFTEFWDQLDLAHADPSDIIFDSKDMPLLLSGDGGVFNTADNGKKWETCSGSGFKGLNALQITEATAQEYFDKKGKKEFIYFGTQDNWMWASKDAGKNWTHYGNEGFAIQTQRKAIMEEGNLMTFSLIDDISQRVSGQGYDNPKPADWTEVPTSAGDPVIVPTAGLPEPYPTDRFVQLSSSKRPAGVKYFFNYTLDAGKTWNTKARMDFAPTAQFPKISIDGRATIYQPYHTGTKTKNGFAKIGLVKVSKINSLGEKPVESAEGNGFGSLGTFATEFKWYNVFAVNPTNPNQLIIADIENSVIKITNDGGKNWYAHQPLTDLITDGGNFIFNKTSYCFVTHISFNPDNPDEIAIGTRQNGICYSWDGGNIWYKLKNTEQITNVSSITFYFDGTLLVSTYGRGLWKVKPEKSKFSTQKSTKIKAFGMPLLFDFATGKLSAAGAFNQDDTLTNKILMAANTADTALTLQKIYTQSIKNVKGDAISSNSLTDLASIINLALPSQNIIETVVGKSANTSFTDLPIRAFIYNEKDQITGIIISTEAYKLYRPGELILKENKNPYFHLVDDSLRTVLSFMRGKTYFIEGQNFDEALNKDEPLVKLYINDQLYKSDISVSSKGFFRTSIKLEQHFGNSVEIKVIQETKSGQIQLTRTMALTRQYEQD
jgi:photosystem II stability/assembly factor-like uncharacterized protein